MNRLIKAIYNFIFPKYCISCNTYFDEGGNLLCNDCIESERKNKIDAMPPDITTNIDRFYMLHSYTITMRQCIEVLKFESKRAVVDDIISICYPAINEIKDKLKADIITSVPLSKQRLHERGFNQASLIAKQIAGIVGIEFIENILKRNKNTKPQSTLMREDRLKNVSNAFVIDVAYKNKITGKRIIVVDDVITTGSTINECAATLKQAGVKEVYAMAVARA